MKAGVLPAAVLCLALASASRAWAASPADATTAQQPVLLPSPLDEAPLQIDQKIDMERLQTREVLLDGVQSFLVVDPSVIDVTRPPGSDQLVVHALSLGTTYLHVWTNAGRRTIEVRVLPALPKPESQRLPPGGLFHMSASAVSDVQSTRYTNLDQTIPVHNQYYNLGMDGPTSLGRFQSNVRYENRNGVEDVSSARAELRNGLGLLEAGDILAPISQLTIPYVGFQGAHYATPPQKRVSLDLLGGYTNREFWGGKYDIGAGVQRNPFAGFKAAVRPVQPLELFAVGSRSFSDLFPDQAKNRGAGAQWSSGSLLVRGEEAQGEAGRAHFADFQFRRSRGQALFTWRDVNPGYVTVNGGSWARGERGWTGETGVHDVGPLTLLDVRYDQFRTGYLPSAVRPGELNQEWRGQAKARNGDLELSQDVILQDMPGTFSSSRQDVYRTKLAQWQGVFQPNLTFRRENGESFLNNSADYEEAGVGSGYLLKPVPFFSQVLSVERVASQNTTTGEKRVFVNLNAGLRLEGSLFSPAFVHLLNVEYREGSQRFSENLRSVFAQARTDYLMDRDLRLYILGQYDREMDPSNPRHTFEAFMGVEWRGDFGGPGGRSRAVKGSVFKDLNGDGIREAGEPGIPGARVTLNDSKTVTTDADGNFEFRPVRGDVSVLLSPRGMPLGTRLSTSNPQTFDAQDDAQTLRVSFGMAYAGEISGKVYIDSNGNGRYDEEDKPVQRAVVALDPGTPIETSWATDTQGRFVFSGVAPGPHNVQLNVLTLPSDMALMTPSRISPFLGEGEKLDLTFLVRPTQILSGTVFWDKNGNGQRDPGEPGVEGIQVRFRDSVAMTDGTGTYFLPGLKPGEGALFVSQVSLGRKWALVDPQSKTFTIPGDAAFMRENVDFAIRKMK